MNIQTFDLNLLRVLDALLRERNVSRAAERLALSQPAVSNALNRLRELLDDPLLVRAGRAMQPTPRALALEARSARRCGRSNRAWATARASIRGAAGSASP